MLYIPKRFIFTFLGFLGLLIVFATRANLGVAIVAMVNDTEQISSNGSHYSAPRYNFDAKTQGIMLSAFYYGYLVTQIPAGLLCERCGVKWFYAFGVFSTTSLYLLIPLAASWGVEAFVTIRIIEGLGQGFTFPAMMHGVGKWAPKSERSRISSMICLGLPFGSVIAMPLSGYLCSNQTLGGWPTTFYMFGTIGCIWFVFWSIFVYESPEDHPYISKEELLYIQETRDEAPQKKAAIPWRYIFTSIPMWSVTVAQVGNHTLLMMLLNETPTYFKEVLHFDIQLNSVLSAMPWVVLGFGIMLSSYLADKLRGSNTLSITNIRKMCTSVGMAGPGICFLVITQSGYRPKLIVCLLSLAMFLNGFIFSGFNITHVDMSPDFAGILYGLANCLANAGAILGPMLVGFLTAEGDALENWNEAFYITAGVYFSCASVFALFASAEIQPWGLAKGDTDAKTNESEQTKQTSKCSKLSQKS